MNVGTKVKLTLGAWKHLTKYGPSTDYSQIYVVAEIGMTDIPINEQLHLMAPWGVRRFSIVRLEGIPLWIAESLLEEVP